MMDRPLTGYHFRVDFGLENFLAKDIAFQSVGPINFEAEYDEEKVGALPYRKYTITGGKWKDLTLKRGMFRGSMLINWMRAQIDARQKIPIPIVVTALDAKADPVYSWFFINAFPFSWTTSGFDAEKSELLVEEISFKYDYFKQVDMAGRSVQKELVAMANFTK
jgi:phage tail-like protein